MTCNAQRFAPKFALFIQLIPSLFSNRFTVFTFLHFHPGCFSRILIYVLVLLEIAAVENSPSHQCQMLMFFCLMTAKFAEAIVSLNAWRYKNNI